MNLFNLAKLCCKSLAILYIVILETVCYNRYSKTLGFCQFSEEKNSPLANNYERKISMKKKITILAAVIAVSTVFTGCEKQTQPMSEVTTSAVVSETSSDNDNRSDKLSDEMSKILEEDHTPIYAYGKENIPELVAKALTALGSREESAFDRCRMGDDWGDTYKQLREHIYNGIEKNGGDPTQTFTCKDFTVYAYRFNNEPNYEVYLKGYENDVVIRIVAQINDIDNQEYYLWVRCTGNTEWSIASQEDKPKYEVAQEKVAEGQYTLIDLSQYETKEDNSNG